MMDFTLNKYKELLLALRAAGYAITPVSPARVGEVPVGREGTYPSLSLRHDVDARPYAAVQMARLEHALGVRSTYYIRSREAYNAPEAIRLIVQAGHEIGYHYEDLSLAHGNPERAWQHFREELNWLREFYPVRTACMHGAPFSPYDGRDLWRHYDYHTVGIDCEPYLDLDYSRLLYLTDTGRCWDGYRMSVRDKIIGYQQEWNRRGWSFHSTDDIIQAAAEGRLPERILLSTHPQRWAVNPLQWLYECTSQPLKNIVKRALVRKKA